MNSVVEIRSFNLWPGMRTRLHALMLEQAMPMLKRWKIDVVSHGPSIHDENSYYLIRRFDSLACIENDTSIVLELDEATIRALRQHPAARPAAR